MATLLNDPMTYAGGSLLGGQGGWVKHPSYGGDMKIAAAGTYARLNSASTHCTLYNTVAVGDGDYLVSVDGSTGANSTFNSDPTYTYVGTRADPSADTCYLAELSVPGSISAGTLTLYRLVAGTPTQVASVANVGSPGGFGLTGYSIQATGTGVTVTVVVKHNGTTLITYNDNNAARIVAPGKPLIRGYYGAAPADGAVGPYFDSVTVTGTAPPAVDLPPNVIRPSNAAIVRASRW